MISGHDPDFPQPPATAITSRRQDSGRKRAERMARDLEVATSRYVRPLLEPGEELLDCAPASRAVPAKRAIATGLGVASCITAMSYLGSTFPAVRYLIAAASGVALVNVGQIFGERVWLAVTSHRALCVAKFRLRPPSLLLNEPAGLMSPASYRRHTGITSWVRWDLPGGRTFRLSGGTRFTELVDALTGQDQSALAD